MARTLNYGETEQFKAAISKIADRYGETLTDAETELILRRGLENTKRMRADIDTLAARFYWNSIREVYAMRKTESQPEPVCEPEPEPETASVSKPADAPVMSAEEGVNPFVSYIKSEIMAEIDEKLNEKRQTEIVVKAAGRIAKIDGLVHKEFATVCAYVQANEPVFLYGRAGTGKNVLCQQVAQALGLEFYFSNAVTQEHKLTGFIDAIGNFHETQFYQAFTKGGLFMLDEMDASIPEVLIILNAAIANRYFDFPNGKVDAHPDFRVIAAGNTTGTGATYEYSGRNQLDAASLDRFAMVEIDYDIQVETGCAGGDAELVDFVHDVRASAEKAGVQIIISYRGINRLAKMIPAIGMTAAIKTGLIKGMDPADLKSLCAMITCNNEYARALKALA